MASRIPHFRKGAPSKHGAGGTENVQAEHFFMGSGGGGVVGFKGMTTKTSKKESSRITEEEEKPKSKKRGVAGRTGIVKGKKKKVRSFAPVKGILEIQGYYKNTMSQKKYGAKVGERPLSTKELEKLEGKERKKKRKKKRQIARRENTRSSSIVDATVRR